jgi:hypothetical protein
MPLCLSPPLSSTDVIPATKVRQPFRRHFSKSFDSLTALSAAGAAAEERKITQTQALESAKVRTRLAIVAMATAKAVTKRRKETRSSRLFASEGHVLAAITVSSRET